MYRINPGSYRHIISFEKISEIQNEYGEVKKDWTTIFTTRASIRPISGREFYQAETVNSEVTHKVNLRYREGIKADMRIKFGERVFEIISVINFEERNIELQLLCKEING